VVRTIVAMVALTWAATIGAHEAHGDTPGSGSRTVRSAKAGLSIGVAVSPAGLLWMVGLNSDGRLFVQTSVDFGLNWQAARLLDIASDKVSADGENRPKIAFGPDHQVVISYTRPMAKPYTGEIRMLRSEDDGKSFSSPFTVHQDRQLITHRFESLAFDRSGILHTVWIDKRDQVLAAHAGGTSTIKSIYAGAAIYRNESRDGGLGFGPDIKVADHACECCRIALAPTSSGGVAALWRHVFETQIRDHAFAILGEEPNVPLRASFDNWQVNACPHHGPGLAASQSGGYHAIWFGEKAGRAAVRYGRLTTNGTPQGEAQELPDPRAEHADIVTFGKQVAIAWRSYDGKQTRLRSWVSADDGAHFDMHELAATQEENDHPRVLSTPAGIRVVWRTTKEVHVLPIQP
jgi:hypothetical protein